MQVLVVNDVTLDGVMRTPGRADGGTRGGFRHGGRQERNDEAMASAMGERMGRDFAWLFGRRSYDDMLSHWNEVGGPLQGRTARADEVRRDIRPRSRPGTHRASRTSRDSLMKVAALTSPVTVEADGDGGLVTHGLALDPAADTQHWVPREPGLFTTVDGRQRIAFDGHGLMVGAGSEADAYERHGHGRGGTARLAERVVEASGAARVHGARARDRRVPPFSSQHGRSRLPLSTSAQVGTTAATADRL